MKLLISNTYHLSRKHYLRVEVRERKGDEDGQRTLLPTSTSNGLCLHEPRSRCRTGSCSGVPPPALHHLPSTLCESSGCAATFPRLAPPELVARGCTAHGTARERSDWAKTR